MDVESRLPVGTMIYRAYEARLPDDTHVQVAVTLDDLADEASNDAASARAIGAEAYGHVVLLDGPDQPSAPLLWACGLSEIHIVTSEPAAEALGEDLREAIGGFVLHFIETLREELELDLGEEPPATTLH